MLGFMGVDLDHGFPVPNDIKNSINPHHHKSHAVNIFIFSFAEREMKFICSFWTTKEKISTSGKHPGQLAPAWWVE